MNRCCSVGAIAAQTTFGCMNQVVQPLEPESWGDMELDDTVIALKSKLDIKKKKKQNGNLLFSGGSLNSSCLPFPTYIISSVYIIATLDY